MNIKEAAQKWVGEFNAIPQSLIEKAYGFDEIYEMELTPIKYNYECDTCLTEFSKEEYNDLQEDSHGLKICSSCLEDAQDVDDCNSIVNEEEDEYSERGGLPMWGTLWTFGSGFDEEWCRNNIEIVSECGFRIYESDELGVFIGIDGAGYDFYENHWIPLYKARGLKWHDDKGEN